MTKVSRYSFNPPAPASETNNYSTSKQTPSSKAFHCVVEVDRDIALVEIETGAPLDPRMEFAPT
jgi:hypothetical protein